MTNVQSYLADASHIVTTVSGDLARMKSLAQDVMLGLSTPTVQKPSPREEFAIDKASQIIDLINHAEEALGKK
jgi:hypothetical protein